jgi:hypothetical protein
MKYYKLSDRIILKYQNSGSEEITVSMNSPRYVRVFEEFSRQLNRSELNLDSVCIKLLAIYHQDTYMITLKRYINKSNVFNFKLP